MCPEEHIEPSLPHRVNGSPSLKQTGQIQGKQIPKVDAHRRTQSLNGLPFHLQSIGVEENDCAILPPVSLLAPNANRVVRVLLPESASVCQPPIFPRNHRPKFVASRL